MASVNPIIVQTGINAGAPFVLNGLTKVTNVGPPAQISSIPTQDLIDTGGSLAEYLSVPTSAGVYIAQNLNATEGLRVNGGAIIIGPGGTGTVQLGFNARANGTDQIAIGRSAITKAGGGAQIVIGAGATTGNNFGNNVIIGRIANGAGSAGVVIGNNAGSGSGAPVAGVIIGDTAQAAGNVGVPVIVIGDGALALMGNGGLAGSVLIGAASVANNTGSVVIGNNAQASLSNTNPINNVVIGDTTTTSKSQTTTVGGGSTNTADNSVIIGAGSGVAGAGTIAIGQANSQTGANADSVIIGRANTVTHAQVIALGGGNTSTAANQAWFGGPSTDIQTLIIGAGDAQVSPALRNIRPTNASGTDNAAGDLIFHAPRSTGAATPAALTFQAAVVGGSSATLQTEVSVITIRGNTVLFRVDRGISFSNQTSAAAAQVATLTNSPTAGNPGFWLKTNINGTNYSIPCWLG